MSVEWVEGVLPGAPFARTELVIAATKALGTPELGRVLFPDDYLDVAQVRQGVRPVPSSFDRPGGFTEGVDHLLHFEPCSFSNIVERRFPLEDVLKGGVVRRRRRGRRRGARR